MPQGPPLAGELGEMKEGDGIIPPTPPGDGAWPKEGDGTWILPGDAAVRTFPGEGVPSMGDGVM